MISEKIKLEKWPNIRHVKQGLVQLDRRLQSDWLGSSSQAATQSLRVKQPPRVFESIRFHVRSFCNVW